VIQCGWSNLTTPSARTKAGLQRLDIAPNLRLFLFMDSLPPNLPPDEEQLATLLLALEPTKRQRVLRKFIMAALGAIPWVGSFLNAAQTYNEEESQIRTDALQRQWLAEHRIKMRQLAQDLTEITRRLESVGDEIQVRIESEAYLALVRKAFRIWDHADTEQKREYVRRLIANAGASVAAPDDLVRLFLDWLNTYHEAHFIVIREIYRNPGVTRYRIWETIHGTFPRDDSSEADLFRLLIGDLSLGRVIRQHRETNYAGQFIKKSTASRGASSGVTKSAFDDEEPYELTELGKKFVHYVFTDAVTKIEN
jgi:hypothetical protein